MNLKKHFLNFILLSAVIFALLWLCLYSNSNKVDSNNYFHNSEEMVTIIGKRVFDFGVNNNTYHFLYKTKNNDQGYFVVNQKQFNYFKKGDEVTIFHNTFNSQKYLSFKYNNL